MSVRTEVQQKSKCARQALRVRGSSYSFNLPAIVLGTRTLYIDLCIMATRKRLQLEKARALSMDKHIEVANMCAALADIYKREGDHRKALQEYKEMESMLAKKYETGDSMAAIKRAIGEAYLVLDETEEAIAEHTEMLSLAEATGDTVEMQRAFATIATTYFVVATLNDNDEEMLRKAGKSAWDIVPPHLEGMAFSYCNFRWRGGLKHLRRP